MESRATVRKIAVAGVLGALTILLALTPLGFIPWPTGVSLTVIPLVVVIGAVLEGPAVGLAIGLVFGVFSLIRAATSPQGPADEWFTNPLLSVLPRLFIGPMAWLVYQAVRGSEKRRWTSLVVSVVIALALSYLWLVYGLEAIAATSWGAAWADATWFRAVVPIVLLVLFGGVWVLSWRWQGAAMAAAGVTGSLTNTFLVLGVIGILGLVPWSAIPPIIAANGVPEAMISGFLAVVILSAWKRIAVGRKQGSSV